MSHVRAGAVLMQADEQGVCFYFKKLNGNKLNYSG